MAVPKAPSQSPCCPRGPSGGGGARATKHRRTTCCGWASCPWEPGPASCGGGSPLGPAQNHGRGCSCLGANSRTVDLIPSKGGFGHSWMKMLHASRGVCDPVCLVGSSPQVGTQRRWGLAPRTGFRPHLSASVPTRRAGVMPPGRDGRCCLAPWSVHSPVSPENPTWLAMWEVWRRCWLSCVEKTGWSPELKCPPCPSSRGSRVGVRQLARWSPAPDQAPFLLGSGCGNGASCPLGWALQVAAVTTLPFSLFGKVMP